MLYYHVFLEVFLLKKENVAKTNSMTDVSRSKGGP